MKKQVRKNARAGSGKNEYRVRSKAPEEKKVSTEAIIARQQIIDRLGRLHGYELLYREPGSANRAAEGLDSNKATFTVVLNALNHFGVQELLGGKKGFINIDHESIFSPAIETIPPDKFVLEILEHTEITEELKKRMADLRQEGFVFALDDFVLSKEMIAYFKPLFPLIKIIKVDLVNNSLASMQKKLDVFKKMKKVLLAEKVETLEDYRNMKKLGFNLFQGYFFAKPEVRTTKKLDISQQGVMRIVSQVEKKAETAEIEETFKHYPDLSLNLLKIVNSAAMGVRYRITDIKQALTMLGREKLASWTFLMMYSNAGQMMLSAPLMQFTAVRAKMMSLLVGFFVQNAGRREVDRAFLTGLVSNSHVLLGIELSEIIESLHLNDDITGALLEKKGELGELLNFLERFDLNDHESVEKIMKEKNIKSEDISKAFMESTSWATSLE